MNIKIKYFASLREKSQKSEDLLEITEKQNLSEIYGLLRDKYNFPLTAKEIKFAVNNEYVGDEYLLKEHDVVAFIPPVAGG
jgi:molybdopterin synthase sulfur carrier subunit